MWKQKWKILAQNSVVAHKIYKSSSVPVGKPCSVDCPSVLKLPR